MKLSKSKPPSSLSFNVTPMIDIVFLLIIFFMTVSQITKTVDSPLTLPRVNEGDLPAQTATVTINLNVDGNLILGGQPITLQKLTARLKTQLQQFDNDPSRIKIQLRCDRQCECRHVTELLENLANLGFKNIRSAVADS